MFLGFIRNVLNIQADNPMPVITKPWWRWVANTNVRTLRIFLLNDTLMSYPKMLQFLENKDDFEVTHKSSILQFVSFQIYE